jgi:putative addiction module killer protein
MELRLYETIGGHRPFDAWHARLDATARARVTAALEKIEAGNLSNAKSVGGGVLEYRIDFGPGYRLYFGRDGDLLVIMIGGGDKRRQQRDINAAIEHWADYRRRKRRPGL